MNQGCPERLQNAQQKLVLGLSNKRWLVRPEDGQGCESGAGAVKRQTRKFQRNSIERVFPLEIRENSKINGLEIWRGPGGIENCSDVCPALGVLRGLSCDTSQPDRTFQVMVRGEQVKT